MFRTKQGMKHFTLGMYEYPRDEKEWKQWTDAGINLLRCSDREQLDQTQERGIYGWNTVRSILADDDDGAELTDRIESLKDHPALAVWEAPDEAIWQIWRNVNKKGAFWRDSVNHVSDMEERLNTLVRGLARGSNLIRERDPGRKIWLNEAVNSSVDVLARCLPWLDAVGFDYYPVPNRFDRPMTIMGPYTRRFRDAAPGKELWIVQQAFSWTSIKHPTSALGGGYPDVDEYRYMAWQSILNGADGLLWWGSRHEDRPAPFLDDLMTVVKEISGLRRFLEAGPIAGVEANTSPYKAPSVLGCGCEVRRVGDETLVILSNGDSYGVDVCITGLDWLTPTDLTPVVGETEKLREYKGRLWTSLEGYETRLYTAQR